VLAVVYGNLADELRERDLLSEVEQVLRAAGRLP
jgi:hypothetical protein